jgi:N-acetylglucosaminyldiphosphoundecaprenol N-acetyl-beta-D-mannosaminyltransferase
MLFVAFGAPNQELWIARNLAKMPSVKVAMGVGGAFDFIAGKQKRAPQIFRSLGLEWLYRLMREPRRIVRIINAVVVFPFLVITRDR